MNRLLRRTGLIIALPVAALAVAGGALAYNQQSDPSPDDAERAPAQETPNSPHDDGSGCPHDKGSDSDASNAV